MADGLGILVKHRDEIPNVIETIEEKLKNYGKVVVHVADARRRSDLQNRLQHLMYREIARQLYGKDEEHAKNECKLTIGVPLLRETSPEFKEVYDKNIRPLSYEAKLQVVSVINVSSLLSVGAAHQYIERIYDDYAQKGVNWTKFITGCKRELDDHGKG
tara:strand:- start:645 stop:1121 length:477 start_codon:yes stop_codon:yes gene_type:complete